MLDVWAGETEKFAPGVRVLVIRSKDQANLEDIKKNTTWSWSTTPSSASAGNPEPNQMAHGHSG
ncbi:MAG: hypothetical protein ACLSUW_00415 [Akkermansia sp.]